MLAKPSKRGGAPRPYSSAFSPVDSTEHSFLIGRLGAELEMREGWKYVFSLLFIDLLVYFEFPALFPCAACLQRFQDPTNSRSLVEPAISEKSLTSVFVCIGPVCSMPAALRRHQQKTILGLSSMSYLRNHRFYESGASELEISRIRDALSVDGLLMGTPFGKVSGNSTDFNGQLTHT